MNIFPDFWQEVQSAEQLKWSCCQKFMGEKIFAGL